MDDLDQKIRSENIGQTPAVLTVQTANSCTAYTIRHSVATVSPPNPYRFSQRQMLPPALPTLLQRKEKHVKEKEKKKMKKRKLR